MTNQQTTYVIATGTLYISYALLATGTNDPSFSFTQSFAKAQQYEKNDALEIFKVFGGKLYQVQSTLTDVTSNPPAPDPDPVPVDTSNFADVANATPVNASGTLTNNGFTLLFTKNSNTDASGFKIPIHVKNRGTKNLQLTATYSMTNSENMSGLTIQAQKQDGTTVDDVLFAGVKTASNDPIAFAITNDLIQKNTLGDDFNLLVNLNGSGTIQLSLMGTQVSLQN